MLMVSDVKAENDFKINKKKKFIKVLIKKFFRQKF